MRILVVVDYQRDFVDGALGSEDAVSIEGAICSRIEDYLSTGDPVIFTMDTHGEDYLQSLEGMMLPVSHCIEGSPGWEIHGRVRGLSEREGCTIIRKGTFGCSDLMGALGGYDEIEICGVATNVCVLSNAVMARTANPNARVIVRRDCVASYDRALGEKALDLLPSIQVEVL